MQSSTAVVLRALVMLVCVVAIPLAAIFGGSLPEVVNTLLEGAWPPQSRSSDETSGRLSWLELSGSRPAASPVPAEPISDNWPTASPQWSGRSDGSPSAVIPADYEAVMASPRRATSIARPQPDPAAGAANRSGTMPFPGTSDERLMPLPAGGEPAKLDRFNAIQDRLRELGATRYLLEYWGSRQQLYRFYCKMAVAGNPNYTRYFEDTDSDPLRAMAEVLRQVEAWRAEQQ